LNAAPAVDELFGEDAAVAIGDCASQLCSLAYSILFQLTGYLERGILVVVVTTFNDIDHFTGVCILRTGKLSSMLARRVCLP
jgi:hypothetical protein